MAAARKKASILVVDDVPNTVEVLERNLTVAGYTVFTASDTQITGNQFTAIVF